MGQKQYRLSEIAALLQVHPKTVYYWVRVGRLRAKATPGGLLRVDACDVAAICQQAGVPFVAGEEEIEASGLAQECMLAAERCKPKALRDLLTRAAAKLRTVG
jgi:excisionase family DNA binding protein